MKSINKLSKEKNITKQEYAKWYFSQQNCELIDEYQHSLMKMKYKCSCGRIAEISWNKFTQRNYRCGYCHSTGRKKKYSFEEVKNIFKQEECELLEKEYNNNYETMKYKCKCGNPSKISLSDFNMGYRCKKCGIIKQSGSNHWAWVSDRKKHRQNQLFRKKCYKALRSTLIATKQKKNGRTFDLLGYGAIELQDYIVNHPNWETVKNHKWHLDHIFPIQAFIDNGIIDTRIINSLDNLQPITQRENNIKKDKYDKKAFKLWLEEK